MKLGTPLGAPLPFSPSDFMAFVGDQAKEAIKQFNLSNVVMSSYRDAVPPNSGLPSSLESDVFASLMDAKMFISSVAMHLPKEWRVRLFKQLDALHDTAEWESGDAPLLPASFRTFVMMVLTITPPIRPSLGLTHDGKLLAAWTAGKDRLTIEFLAGGRVRTTMSKGQGDNLLRAALEFPAKSFFRYMQQYDLSPWLLNAKPTTSA